MIATRRKWVRHEDKDRELDTHHSLFLTSHPLVQTHQHDVCVIRTTARWTHFEQEFEEQALRDCEDVRTEGCKKGTTVLSVFAVPNIAADERHRNTEAT